MTYSIIAKQNSNRQTENSNILLKNGWKEFEIKGWDVFIRSLPGVSIEEHVEINQEHVSVVIGSPTNLIGNGFLQSSFLV